ncbi:hypothetical protein WJX84_000577 [Apatococcus fuscideae]|uniref:Peptidase S8/S53 domain-containing protein n=1 Tax=Apatococcus fuscideae TaxID=2026836 RepID=A0AAW1TCS3_9CHLO
MQDPQVTLVEPDRVLKTACSAGSNRLALRSYKSRLDGTGSRAPGGKQQHTHAGSRALLQHDAASVPGQTVPTGVARSGGPVQGTFTAAIAVLDSGVGPHQDLNILSGYSCISNDGNTDDDSLEGHGTHVSGSAAAMDNDFGVIGIAPGAPIVPVKVADRQGSASISSVLCGIEWVLQNKAAAVINLSLDGAATSADKVPCDGTDATSALHQAICGAINQGVIVTASAGNDANLTALHIPAVFPEVMSAGSLTDYNGKAGGGAHAITCG